jgi:hypothetical protein
MDQVAMTMPKRINANELEKLIADDSVSDEAIAPYLKRAPVRALPFEPMLAIDEKAVEAPATRGIIGLTVTALNARSNRRRLAAYEERLKGGWKGLKILAEGDSWFLYPVLLRDIVDNLSADYAIYSAAAAGDTLENIVRGAAHLEELIVANGFDAMLLSAGGNDIAGDPLGSYLRELKGPAAAPGDYVTEKFEEFLTAAKARIGMVAGRLISRFPNFQIFGHGYDWPFPHPQGFWLESAFLSRNIPIHVRGPILRIMIDRYYEMLHQVAAASNGRFHVVDCRGAIGPLDQWFDELHPLNPGFARAAGRFRDNINRVFGVSRGTAGQAEARLSWWPREDRSGTRKHTRVFPQGAIITAGRSADREIVLDDEKVSRNHALFCVAPDGIDVEDSSSTNGTFIDGKRILKARWSPGHELSIGCFSFNLEFVPAPLTGPVAVPPAPALLSSHQSSSAAPAILAGQALRRLEIVVSNSSISQDMAPAWAIAVFQNVNPLAASGPARAIDDHLDGLLSDIFASRMVEGALGTILPVPIPLERGSVRNLFLAGLGAISDFLPKAVETAGESLARMLVATHVFELATVPIGANSGISLKGAIESFLTGFLRGLHATDGARGFCRLTLCELKPDRYLELKYRVEALNASGAFKAQGFEVIATTQTQEAKAAVGELKSQSAPPSKTAFLGRTYYVEVTNKAHDIFEYALLGMPGAAAPCFTGTAAVSDGIKCVIDAPGCPRFDAALGEALADAYMPEKLQAELSYQLTEEPGRLVVIHDAASAAVPWEASFIDGRSLALDIGISRQYKPTARSAPAKEIPRKRPEGDERLRMLLVYDPTSDLSGAEAEAKDLNDLFSNHHCEVKLLRREECTKNAVMNELKTGGYDLLHFAGHGKFTQSCPEESGIVLSGPTFFSAADLESLPTVPRLIFLNACQSGRVRDAAMLDSAGAASGRTNHASLAEGFIQRNVKQFIGTYWLVNDASAHDFALSCYSEVLMGRPVGEAIRTGRRTLAAAGLNDWVNYLHFGDPGELLRRA